jgi:hypothetical protein
VRSSRERIPEPRFVPLPAEFGELRAVEPVLGRRSSLDRQRLLAWVLALSLCALVWVGVALAAAALVG